MTMKEHLDKLTQEKESGVTFTDEEATARKKAIADDAKAEVAGHLLVTELLMNALHSIPTHLNAERDASSKCLEMINQMCHEDVKAE